MSDNKLLNLTALLITISLTVYILYIGKTILLPFVVALAIWYIIISIANAYQKIEIKNWRLPSLIALLLAIITTFLFLNFFIILFTKSISGIINDAPIYQKKLQWLIEFISNKMYSKIDIQQVLKHVDLGSAFTSITFALTSLAQNLVLISIYVLFLLLETYTFDAKMKAIFSNTDKYKKAIKVISQIKNNINSYIKIKTFISFLTALISYFILILFSVSNAEFFALLIFLLNYIPTIGPIIAVALILLIVSVYPISLSYFIAVASSLIAVQFIMGNIIEPRFTGKNLNLSPLIVLLSLAVWGKIWGILGMVLSVPLMTIINIILGQFESTRPIAIFLSGEATE